MVEVHLFFLHYLTFMAQVDYIGIAEVLIKIEIIRFCHFRRIFETNIYHRNYVFCYTYFIQLVFLFLIFN